MNWNRKVFIYLFPYFISKMAIEEDLDILPEYKEVIERCSKNNEDFFIQNATLAHAIYLSKHLIDKARKTINIFSGELKEMFYDNKYIREAFEKAVKGGVKVKIILEHDARGESEDFASFCRENNIEVLKLKEPLGKSNHFLLSDESSFRIEKPHRREDFDEENYKIEGVVNFNKADWGKDINRAFSSLLPRCEPLWR